MCVCQCAFKWGCYLLTQGARGLALPPSDPYLPPCRPLHPPLFSHSNSSLKAFFLPHCMFTHFHTSHTHTHIFNYYTSEGLITVQNPEKLRTRVWTSYYYKLELVKVCPSVRINLPLLSESSEASPVKSAEVSGWLAGDWCVRERSVLICSIWRNYCWFLFFLPIQHWGTTRILLQTSNLQTKHLTGMHRRWDIFREN